MKKILICFGGISPEHDVSIITGLQVLEHIDRTKYNPFVLYITKQGELKLLRINSRIEFLESAMKNVSFGRDKNGGYVAEQRLLSSKIYIDCAYLAFHGGIGESGSLQGVFETMGIPYTSPSVESSSVSMNKALTKEVVSMYGVDVIPGLSVKSAEILKKPEKITKEILSTIKLPLIIKPSHFGSSIGVVVAKTEISLTKALMAASLIDSEIVIEKYINNFTEYNCSVRKFQGKIETSEIERPLSKLEILSFADKYERGSKKTGGMASLSRELPAKLTVKLKSKIEDNAKKVYIATRSKGVVRCDFLYSGKKLYLLEINPIPGSMSFYLWEAKGNSFESQISELIEESISDYSESKKTIFDHQTDIAKRFINSKDQ